MRLAAPTRGALIASALFALALWGCGRRAPEPRDCLAFSLRWHRISGEQLELAPAALRESFEQLTVRCLTQPFDGPWVRCIAETGRNACGPDPSERRPLQSAR